MAGPLLSPHVSTGATVGPWAALYSVEEGYMRDFFSRYWWVLLVLAVVVLRIVQQRRSRGAHPSAD